MSPEQEAAAQLAQLAARTPRLELSTVDICFLAALELHSRSGAVSAFSESQLFDWFEEVAELVEPELVQVRRRASAAIARLRDQRLLTRVDGAGVLRSGEYALTRLGSSIVEFFLEDEALTTESLNVIMRTLQASLCDVLARCRAASDAAALTQAVVGPLQITVRDLVGSIERRQRGLDLQQERFQKEVATLLESDWFGALSSCQELLEQTSGTLRELNELLLGETQKVHGLLEDLEELVAPMLTLEIEQAIRLATEHVDRVAAWSLQRQKAWSEYYQYVHRFLRDVVRLDPSRALTHRLREQLSGRRGRAFSLTVTTTTPLIMLREIANMPDRPAPRRPRSEREKPLNETAGKDRWAMLEERVQLALDNGAVELSQVTAEVTAETAEEQRFLTAGRIAQIVGKLAKTGSTHERPWAKIDPALEIEEWSLLEHATANQAAAEQAARKAGSR